MTSSNVPPTSQGPAATAKASPPPDPATFAALADASGAAATTPTAPNATTNEASRAPANATPSRSTDEVDNTVVSHLSLANLPTNQLQPDQSPNETNPVLPIPSPPTVSPLSTPAATNVNVDEGLSDEPMAKLTADVPPLSLTRDPSIFRTGIFGPQQSENAKTSSIPDGMELDEPFMPDETNYHRRNQLQAIATTDPDPHDTEYSSHGLLRNMRLSQGSIDPSAYMMNLAAQATLFQDHGPSVIDPSAVSLHSLTQGSEALSGSAEPASLNESQKLESFAKIEFADSTFQMTTYAVIIGRDQQALEQARADERREVIYRRKCEENERNGLPPPTPVVHDRGKFSKSYVSEEGGMLGPEHSDGEDVKPAKKRRPSSAAQFTPGEDNALGDHVQSNRQYVSHTPGAAAVDMSALQPSPGHIPFIGIHSPGPDIASKTRGISRQHLKIQFNKKRGVFEGIALHKNGFFCEDILYGLDNPATLRSGDRLQIKDVEFFFVINGVQFGMSGGEDEDVASSKRMSIGGKEMSLDFEHSDHENFKDTSDELSDVENIPTPVDDSGQSDEEPEPAPAQAQASRSESIMEPQRRSDLDSATAQPVASEGQQPSETVKPEMDMPADIPPEFAMPDIPKRRGPGRPPKDGIMSKRERRLLKKQMQETSKKALPQDQQEEKIKRPVGRPRKNPLPEDGEQPEKRKYNKKKREDGEGGSDVEKRVKEKKDKKVRPKSPPLDLRREDYTAEQLQKPTKNYGVLIDEALTNGPPDGLTLKQIYKRITAKYPWFFFTAETKGWESSVRHNLIGNEAFKKDEETGLWSRVPGVELDAGKKRKVSSPDRHLGPSHLHPHLSHSPYYQNNPYSNAGSVTYAHGLPNYSTEQKHLHPGHTSIVQNSQLHATAPQAVNQPVYTAHVPAPAQLPASYNSLGLSRPSNAPQQSTYSSPYARPPPPANPPTKAESSLANSQTPTAPSTTLPAASAQQQQQPKSSTATAVPKEHLTPEIERAIVQFSANMLEVISERTPHAASIIEAAANRIRGLPVQNRVPGFDSVEATLVNAMQVMIKDMRRNQQNTSASPIASAPVQTSSTPSPAPPNTVEAEIQRRLRNFRESMVTALKTKTDKAELVVDSAINRARGLPHGGKIPGWEEADNLMVKSVTQIIEEARSAYNLKFQNTPPTAANASRAASSQPVQSASHPSASSALAQAPTSAAPPVAPSNGVTASSYTPGSQPPMSSVPNTNTSSMGRPNMPLQRPAPVAFTRLPTTTTTTGPTARPATVLHKDPATAPALASGAAPPPVQRPNVSSPALPSAGVLDQITGHKRFTDDAFHKSHGVNSITSNSYTGNSTSVSSHAVNTSGVNIANSSLVRNTAASGATASSITGPTSGKGGITTSIITDNAPPTSATKAPNNVSGSVASKPASSTPSGASSALTSSAISNVASGAAGSSLGDTVGRPAVGLPGNANNPTIPRSSAPEKIISHPISNALSNVARNPTSNALGNAMSIPSSGASTSAPSNLSSHVTNGAVNNSISSNMANGSSIVANATIVNATKNNAASNVNGSTPRLPGDHIMNTTAATAGKTTAPQSATTDKVNHATVIVKDAIMKDSQGGPVDLVPGYSHRSTTNISKDVTTVKNEAPVGGTAGAQANNMAGESSNGKVATEKSSPSNIATTDHHEPTASKALAPTHNISGPAPPSAGVVDQIAGHKRSLDEGPGSANGEQPEAKKGPAWPRHSTCLLYICPATEAPRITNHQVILEQMMAKRG